MIVELQFKILERRKKLIIDIVGDGDEEEVDIIGNGEKEEVDVVADGEEKEVNIIGCATIDSGNKDDNERNFIL